MMQTDVKAVWCGDGPTVAYADRTRIRALTISYKASVVGNYSSVRVWDSKELITDPIFSPYPLVFFFEAPLVDGSIHVIIPGEGILAKDGLSIYCTSGTTVTVYYG
jgi:hypothetical protein